jgi:hypothetical protein
MMELEAPPIHRHGVQILTAHFQLSGQVETVGSVDTFINDPARDCFVLHDVRLAPLASGSPLKPLSRPHAVICRSEIALLHFTSAETQAAIRTLQRRELLVAYTPVAVCRGYFHMPTEANVNTFLGVTSGSLLPITEAYVFPLIELPDPFPAEADMLLVGRTHLRFYHPA